MIRELRKPSENPGVWSMPLGRVCVGQLLGRTAEGRPVVDFPANPIGPMEARILASLSLPGVNLGESEVSVMLAFDEDDVRRPIIVGVVSDRIREPQPSPTDCVTIDRDRVTLDAKREVVLRCGKSSITLRKDGKILISGTDIVSRASQRNRIKGSTVAIN